MSRNQSTTSPHILFSSTWLPLWEENSPRTNRTSAGSTFSSNSMLQLVAICSYLTTPAVHHSRLGELILLYRLSLENLKSGFISIGIHYVRLSGFDLFFFQTIFSLVFFFIKVWKHEFHLYLILIYYLNVRTLFKFSFDLSY